METKEERQEKIEDLLVGKEIVLVETEEEVDLSLSRVMLYFKDGSKLIVFEHIHNHLGLEYLEGAYKPLLTHTAELREKIEKNNAELERYEQATKKIEGEGIKR